MEVLHFHIHFPGFPHWVTMLLDYRSLILFSLSIQIILILLAPCRKKTANGFVLGSIWLAYLLADYIFILAVGITPFYNPDKYGSTPHVDLLTFWSPFLLVHSGGADTITALSIEDNKLWKRTALQFSAQIYATVHVYFHSAARRSLLLVPTVFMFVVGILKYLERIVCLQGAKLTGFKWFFLHRRSDPGPNYAKLMESYHSYVESNLPTEFNTNPEPDGYRVPRHTDTDKVQPDENSDADLAELNTTGNWEFITSCLDAIFRRNKQKRTKLKNVQTVREAYAYFDKYRGLYADMIFSFRDRSESREDFLNRNSVEAFKLIETELNFTYDVLFSKMILFHYNLDMWTLLRTMYCTLEVTSLLIWILYIAKKGFDDKDIRITYILLGGAIFLDIIAIFRVLFSDWKVALLNKESEVRAFLYDKMLSVHDRTWGRYWGADECPWGPYLRRMFFRRWSESVLQFYLITYCGNPWSIWGSVLNIYPFVRYIADELAYVSKKWFADDLRDFIFDEIKYKAEIAEDSADAADVCQSTGNWVLRSLAGLDFNPFEFYPWTVEVEYDECLLIWHIATELLYQEEEPETKCCPNFFKSRLFGCIHSYCSLKDDAKEKEGEAKEKDYRKYCKTLSDYMMYLLCWKPQMLSPVAGISQNRLWDTHAEATKLHV